MIVSSQDVEGLARCLNRGELVIHPTESVYGIGGLLEEGPLDRLRKVKGRTEGGFVVLLPSGEGYDDLLGPVGKRLAKAFWPGALTLVVDDPENRFHPAAKGPDGSVAIRFPDHPAVQELLKATGRPITSTSANVPGEAPAVTAEAAQEVVRALDQELALLDAGELSGGLPSTLLRLDDGRPTILRSGKVGAAEIGQLLGVPPRELSQVTSLGGEGFDETVEAVEEKAVKEEWGEQIVTFVCTGNTCRSPMAAALARRTLMCYLRDRVSVVSAGTVALRGAPASESARRVVAEDGLNLERHQSIPLTEELIESSTWVLGMEDAHVNRAMALGAGDKALLLREAAGEKGPVLDPFGGGDDLYRYTFLELKHLVEMALKRLDLLGDDGPGVDAL